MNRTVRSIAVVDDEPEMRLALTRLLQAHGFHVLSCASGTELLSSDISCCDCILLDLHMPGVSGFDVLSQLRGRGSHPPVVVFTGHDEHGNLTRLRSLGAADYLLKPVDQSTLLAAIDGAAPAGSATAEQRQTKAQ